MRHLIVPHGTGSGIARKSEPMAPALSLRCHDDALAAAPAGSCAVDAPADEMFVLNKRHVLGICDLLIERGYDLNIWAYARVTRCTTTCSTS